MVSKLKIGLVISFFFIFTGCARSVTNVDGVLSVKFSINYRGNINPSNAGYLIIFSKESSGFPKLPNKRLRPFEYFPTPGLRYVNVDSNFLAKGGLSHLYKNYYTSWNSYIYANRSSVRLFGGNGFLENTVDNFDYVENNGITFKHNLLSGTRTLEIEFELTEILKSSQRINFTICTTLITDTTESGYFQDVIDIDPVLDITKKGESTLQVEIEDTTIPAYCDIVSWKFEIF